MDGEVGPRVVGTLRLLGHTIGVQQALDLASILEDMTKASS